jgi:LuxR family maltose regulon positive regulatory protein
VRGLLELARGRFTDALAACRAAERLAGHLAAPHGSYFVTSTRGLRLHALVRLGDTGRAEQTLGGLREEDRGRGETRVAEAVLRLAQDDPRAAAAALAPVLDGSAPVAWPNWRVNVFVLEAVVRDALSDRAAAWRALERALDIAEPDRMLFPFLLYRAPGLLERHARDCAKHAALVSEILTLLTTEPGPADPAPDGHPGPETVLGSGKPPRGKEWPGGDRSPELIEPLSRSEMRVLRYLPTNLSAPEIARELSVSVTTVRTHVSHLFAKLGAHRRTEAVARARDLGLLAPSPVRRAGQLRATVLCPGPRCLA